MSKIVSYIGCLVLICLFVGCHHLQVEDVAERVVKCDCSQAGCPINGCECDGQTRDKQCECRKTWCNEDVCKPKSLCVNTGFPGLKNKPCGAGVRPPVVCAPTCGITNCDCNTANACPSIPAKNCDGGNVREVKCDCEEVLPDKRKCPCKDEVYCKIPKVQRKGHSMPCKGSEDRKCKAQ